MKVDLVFRTVGERTSDLALELAVKNIQPDNVHLIENLEPFSKAVQQMLKIESDSDFIVHFDADCLLFQDIRPWFELNDAPYVDCFVKDRFRGDIHCGVHITRKDLYCEMQAVALEEPTLAYVLRPESAIRKIAMSRLGLKKATKRFDILHDHFQSYEDIFAKYALRELRSRVPKQKERLEKAIKNWGHEPEYQVARAAITKAKRDLPDNSDVTAVSQYIESLRERARIELGQMDIGQQSALQMSDVAMRAIDTFSRAKDHGFNKVFGVGLSRTGTRSLTAFLNKSGLEVSHYPTDSITYRELMNADFNLTLLDYYDGLTDITAAAFFADLDRAFPNSKFILTIRDEEAWLRSAEAHWRGRDPFVGGDIEPPRSEDYLEMRRFLRTATYGSVQFDRDRFYDVYRRHTRAVLEHFEGRPNDLLVLDVTKRGNRRKAISDFLGIKHPEVEFPHKGGRLSQERRAQGEHNVNSVASIHVDTFSYSLNFDRAEALHLGVNSLR